MFALPLPARLSKLKSRAPECHLNRSAHGPIYRNFHTDPGRAYTSGDELLGTAFTSAVLLMCPFRYATLQMRAAASLHQHITE